MTTTLLNKRGTNNTVITASILITAGSVLLGYFQYDLWTGRCEHLTEVCQGCTRLELEYKPSTCESSAACSWAAATYLGVGVILLWIEKHRSISEMRTYNDVDSAEERMAMKISMPPVSIPFCREDETPQGDQLQVV